MKPYNIEYRKYYKVPEWENKLPEEIAPYIDPEEWERISHYQKPRGADHRSSIRPSCANCRKPVI